jgi:hypothetical protein
MFRKNISIPPSESKSKQSEKPTWRMQQAQGVLCMTSPWKSAEDEQLPAWCWFLCGLHHDTEMEAMCSTESRLTFIGLNDIISRKIKFFIATAERTSHPTLNPCFAFRVPIQYVGKFIWLYVLIITFLHRSRNDKNCEHSSSKNFRYLICS